MENYAINSLKITLVIFFSCLLYACSSNKDTAMSRAMQNLTSRYNYIYNANLILDQHQTALTEAYADNYDEVLPVYVNPEAYDIFNDQPGGSMPDMEEIIKKARVLLLEKTYGNYQDDAYLLLGKANFYKGNYFNAEEYFDYTAKTYPGNTKSRVIALDWKARSLMQLGKYSEAAKVLDTLSNTISGTKSHKAEPLATIAQIYIHQRMASDAIELLQQAQQAHPSKQQRIRWNYILAQLYEKQENYNEALRYYRKVEKSSAPFEMYFNANLNRIKLNAFMSGLKINKQQELLAMLKDDKNEDYHDQIYYQVAESYARDQNYLEADKYYKLSLRNSTKNMYQKGLSYLKIADLNFKHFHDYIHAKLYYDSTVNTLPKTYPGYELVVKKTQNLQYLTDRYEQIAFQDTLQSLAKLPEAERLAKVRLLVNPVIAATKTINTVNNIPASPFPTGNDTRQKGPASSNFYFANQAAISTGFNDFKKKWGNRKLELNWRQSIKSSAQETNQGITKNYATNNGVVNPDQKNTAMPDSASKIKTLLAEIPTTAAGLAISDQKEMEAYYEIANFYLQELNSPKEAAEVYETLLKHFPNNDRLASIYYGLFLANKTIDPAKAEVYKQKVLKDFASSSYAKTILDPAFSMKQSEMEIVVNKQYNDLFDLYEKKDFASVILKADEVLQASPDNYLAPQFAYLKAIAIGRTAHVDQLITAFEKIKVSYPNDQLIVPLVKEHLNYISQHLEEFKQRAIALADFDANEPKFFAQQFPAKATDKVASKTNKDQDGPPKVIPFVPQIPVAEIPVKENPAAEKPVVPAPAVKAEGIFNTAPSKLYYYVVHVADASLTLSSSRFGIGQYNRGNYAENNLRHQLKEFDNDQLIFVGNFGTFDDAKTYADGINPQLKQIMKVPANLYKSFIISKENFDKLSSKDLLNKYLEFYKNNY
ncbi:type IX secretion system periplasmic lipoprotein PorW/SprE [Pedobacter gandavensis]|uniref:Tetratricopeptide repeat protein n=1 Tax=Pedobacter gandavensis TaxID=2679963 RepID=A0ABR6F1R4_9SPHI|nr:tetratricopeptide repeat protein [Pedobacter gandavensis]MBB2151167.1 tetratricopeptide repeat protein [Pedobacter gandavensis]